MQDTTAVLLTTESTMQTTASNTTHMKRGEFGFERLHACIREDTSGEHLIDTVHRPFAHACGSSFSRLKHRGPSCL